MTWQQVALQASYFTVLGLLALYGLHRFSLTWARLRRGAGGGAGLDASGAHAVGRPLPTVTVQLPVYNEYYVVERLIDAACALDYPADLLEIQVLDDSTDRSVARAARLVELYRARGVDIHHIHRRHRKGFKAGALRDGLARARGEVVAIFDADFVPPPDFLRRAVVPLSDPGVGMVQARWGHIDRDHSVLTRAQALMLDGHFAIEHAARQATGRFLNFNGTAGVFRRQCIEDAGGWQDDTLTEDLDLSYRAQLAGWRFVYLHDLVVPAELPVEINSLRTQQRRWAKGSIQTAVKLLGRVASARLPLKVKIEAVFHLTNNAAYLLLAVLGILLVPALAARAEMPWSYYLLDLPLFAAGTGSFTFFCVAAQRDVRRDWHRALMAMPGMMALGIGLAFNNGWAVLEGLFSRSSEFQRTPKFRMDASGAGNPSRWQALGYRGHGSPLVIVEAALAVHFGAAVVRGFLEGRHAALPFLALFASGFFYVTALTIAQDLSRRLLTWTRRPEEAPAP